MKAKHIQNGLHGCGLFSIANVMNLSDFITEDRIEASKVGNTHFQLSTWLMEDGHNIYLSPLYCTCFPDTKVPEDICSLKNIDDQHTPLVISGQYKNGQLSHMVAVLLDGKSNLTIIDSFTGKVTEMPFKDIQTFFECVHGIYGLVDATTQEYIGFINNWGADYLKTL